MHSLYSLPIPDTYCIGIDLCSIQRIYKLLDQYGDRFLQKICTKNEINDLQHESMIKKSRKLAAIFSCKEAVSKALGYGISKQFSFHHIELTHHSSGQPYIKKLKSIPINNLSVSISYEDIFVITVVLGKKIPCGSDKYT